jgi:hypothetical protein
MKRLFTTAALAFALAAPGAAHAGAFDDVMSAGGFHTPAANSDTTAIHHVPGFVMPDPEKSATASAAKACDIRDSSDFELDATLVDQAKKEFSDAIDAAGTNGTKVQVAQRAYQDKMAQIRTAAHCGGDAAKQLAVKQVQRNDADAARQARFAPCRELLGKVTIAYGNAQTTLSHKFVAGLASEEWRRLTQEDHWLTYYSQQASDRMISAMADNDVAKCSALGQQYLDALNEEVGQ